MPKIHALSPCLWFDSQAEGAERFHAGIFQMGTFFDVDCAGRVTQAVMSMKKLDLATLQRAAG